MKTGKDSIFGLSHGAFAAVLVTTVGFAFMFVVFPLFSDDFMYMDPLMGYFERGESPWAGLWENWVTHYFIDNLRLSNIVFTLFLLLPKWVGCTLSGVVFFLILRMMLLTACGGDRPVPVWAAIWMCLLFTFALPWLDQIVIMCFQFNYIWPSALALLCLRVFMGDTRCSALPAAILGFVTGWWHEGFSVPVIAGFVVLMLIWRRHFVSRKNLLLTCGLIVGTLVVILAPSFLWRFGNTGSSIGDILYNLVYVLRYYIPGLLFIAIAALMLLTRRTRPAVLTPLCVFILVCLAVNYTIHVRANFAARIGWWSNLCSIMGIVYLGYSYFKIHPLRAKASAVLKVVSVLAAVFMMAHLAYADYMTVKVKNEIDNIHALYAVAPDEPGQVVFADFTDQLSAPAFAFQKPYYNTFNYTWNNNQCARWRYGKKYPLCVVPTQLEYVDGTQGDLLPGGVRRIAKNIYYTRCDEAYECRGGTGKVKIRGRYIPSLFYLTSFISKADGKRYLYIYPVNMAFRSAGATIDDVVIETVDKQ